MKWRGRIKNSWTIRECFLISQFFVWLICLQSKVDLISTMYLLSITIHFNYFTRDIITRLAIINFLKVNNSFEINMIDRLTDILTDWLTDWLIDSLTDWLTDWLIDWLIHWLIEWSIDWLTVTDWPTDWLIDCLKSYVFTVTLWVIMSASMSHQVHQGYIFTTVNSALMSVYTLVII